MPKQETSERLDHIEKQLGALEQRIIEVNDLACANRSAYNIDHNGFEQLVKGINERLDRLERITRSISDEPAVEVEATDTSDDGEDIVGRLLMVAAYSGLSTTSKRAIHAAADEITRLRAMVSEYGRRAEVYQRGRAEAEDEIERLRAELDKTVDQFVEKCKDHIEACTEIKWLHNKRCCDERL